MPIPAEQNRPPLLAVGLVSAVAISYEILLMRLFSIIQWHHFAYMIISIALLGYGASGTFIALLGNRLKDRYETTFLANVILFGISIPACYAISQRISFNPEELFWDIGQPFRLLLLFLLSVLPFFFAANCIALTLACHRDKISRTYASDLLGAGLGSIGIVLMQHAIFPHHALIILSAITFLAGALVCRQSRLLPGIWTIAFLAATLITLLLPDVWLKPAISPYKSLSMALRLPDTKIIAERSSPLGLISVVESSRFPWRYAPGLSLNATSEPPPQLGVFTDAGNMTAFTSYAADRSTLSYLDMLTSALPYHLGEPKNILILGAGGGSEILQAVPHNAQHIDAVEINPQIVELARHYKKSYGNVYSLDNVETHIAEARGYMTGNNKTYDLIQVALLDSFAASNAGLYALNESYLYTVEAFREYFRHLGQDGYLAVTRWIKMPPRDTLKLFATAIQALEEAGVDDIGRRLLVIRGWQTGTLLVKNGAISDEEIQLLRDFCDNRSFDTAYYPGITARDANRFNILRKPYFFSGAQALLNKNGTYFLRRYKFNLKPATDDRPYFHHFLKWRSMQEFLTLRDSGGLSFIEWGYPVLLATLLIATVTSAILIVLPLLFHNNMRQAENSRVGRSGMAAYFFSIGLAFLFLEIAFIQKFILFLHHPVYAAAIVLASFLIFAGLGSLTAERTKMQTHHQKIVNKAVIGIIIISLMYIVGLNSFFRLFMATPATIRVILSILLLAPLAFCMGFPFPIALSHIGKHEPALIPWAWAVNGCASVMSAVLAMILAVHFGFSVVVLLALILYWFAARSFPNMVQSGNLANDLGI